MRILTNALAAALVLVTLAVPAFAQRGRPLAEGDYIIVESQWGRGTVSGPVRRGPQGWQVRLPGGTWIDCVRSCSQTLRRATVDFWETVGPHAPDKGPEYFRWQFRF